MARQEAEEKAKRDAEERARANSPLGSLPTSVPHGRCGPALCILSVLSPPNGSHRIVQSTGLTEGQNEFPCFAPEGVAVRHGKWYLEMQVKGKGSMQLGFVIRDRFTCTTGSRNGVGDDKFSWAYDGNTPKIYNGGTSTNIASGAKWQANDIVGLGVDLEAHTLFWTLNGAEVARVDLCSATDFKPGHDELVPAASLAREGVFWRFVAADLKYLPTGYSTLQEQPTPWILVSPLESDKVDPTKGPDSLGDPTLMSTLIGMHAPTRKTPAGEKAGKAFAALRGGACEYGFDHLLGGVTMELKNLSSNAFDGTLPKLEFKRGVIRDAEEAEKKFGDLRTNVRRMNWTLIALLYLYGSEEGIRPVVQSAAPIAALLTGPFLDALQKLRYVAAIQNRKNGFCDYGLYYELEKFTSAMNKDRSKMNEKDTEAQLKEIDVIAKRLVGWREWFIKQVQDLPFHTAALAVVDEHMKRYADIAASAAAELQVKAVAKAEKDLKDKIEGGRRRIKEALAEFDRFPDRAEQKYKEMNQELEGWYKEAAEAAKSTPPKALSGPALAINTPAAREWAAELQKATQAWKEAEDLRRLTRAAQDETRNIMSQVNFGLDAIDHHNKEKALEHLHKARGMVEDLKKRPGFFGLALVTQFFTDYEAKMDKLEKTITQWTINRESSEESRELGSAVSRIADSFDHYRNEEALQWYHKAEERRKALAQKTEWAHLPVVQEALAKAATKGAKFITDYKERVLVKQADEQVRECERQLTTARDALSHHRHEESITAIAKCKELTTALRGESMLQGVPRVTNWVVQFEKDVPELEGKIKKTLLDREVADAVREVVSTFDRCEDHFSHYRFEDCLTWFAKYRSLGAALESNKRFAGHPVAEECLRKFDVNVPAFEAKYKSTMLQREYTETLRTLSGKLDTANDHFDHHRTEAALTLFHAYKEAVQQLSKREDFASLGATDVVKKANEQLIPEWQNKYTAKVLAKTCGETIRGIESALGTARNKLDHHDDEGFLVALRDAEARVAAVVPKQVDGDASGDIALIYKMPEMQDTLKSSAQTIYELKQAFDIKSRERLISDAIRACESAYGSAKDQLFHSRFEDAMKELVRAHQAADELSGALYSVGQERVSTFLAKFTTDLKELDVKISETLHQRRMEEAKRNVSSLLSNAQNCFDHYRNEDALKELNKAKDACDGLEADYGAATATEVASHRAAFGAFETAYKERVLTKEATEAVQRARGEFSLAEQHLSHSRFEKAIESLSNAKLAYASVIVESKFRGMPIVAELERDLEPKLKELAASIDATVKGRQVDSSIRTLQSAASDVASHFDHHRNEQALEAFAKTKSMLEELQSADNKPRQAEAAAAAEKVAKEMTDFQIKYREREMATKIRDMTGSALSRLKEAEDALEHSRFEEALEKSHAASALAAQVGADPMLIGAAEVDAFIVSFRERSAALTQRWKSTMRSRAEYEARSKATSALSEAKDHFDHHRDENSLVKLQQAREAVSAFAAEFGEADGFVAEQRKAQAEFQVQYSDRVFKAEIDRKMSKATSRLASAADALEHHRHEEAMRVLQEADEAAGVLASDERFLNHAQVNAFLSEYRTNATALRTRINVSLKERAAADAKRELESAMGDAENLYSHFRFEEALTAIAKVQSLLEDGDATNYPDISRRVAAFKDKYQKEHLARDVESLISKARSQLSQAEFFLDHHRHEEAIQALHAAREQAQALNDAKFDGIASVKEFFDTWATKLRAVESAINGRVLGKRAREATDEVKSLLSEATTALDKGVPETALERLQQARDKAAAVREDNQLASVDSVKAALMEFDKQAAALSSRFAQEVYGRELQDALHKVRSHLTHAEMLFSRFAFENSLVEFNDARDAASALAADQRFSSDASVSAFLKDEWAHKSKAFITKYADQVLTDDARKIIAESRTHLAKSIQFMDRDVRDKAEEALKEAQTAATPLLAGDSLMASLSLVAPFIAELKAAEAKFADKFLKAEAEEVVKEAQKHLQLAARARSRALDSSAEMEAARKAAAPLLGTSSSSPVSVVFAALTPVSTFITGELVPAFATDGAAGSSILFEGKKSQQKSSNKDTIDTILGPRLPYLDIIRKGVPYVPISTDVKPLYFYALKKTNECAKVIEREVKTFINTIKNATWESDKDPLSHRVSPIQYLPIADVESQMVEFSKYLPDLLKEAPEEPLTKRLVGELQIFHKAWSDSVAVAKRFDGLCRSVYAADWNESFIQAIVADYDGICCSTCPRTIELHSIQGFTDSNTLNVDWSSSKLGDYAVFLFVGELCDRAINRIKEWSKQYGGFPKQEARIQVLRKIALEAKKVHCLALLFFLHTLITS